jgi:tetratricopeptide (TPR) repeat protein
VKAGARDGALRDAQDRAGRYPRDLALRAQLAEALLAAGQLDEAEAEARRVLKQDDRQVAALVHLATASHLRGRHELARTILDGARELAPQDPVVWNRLGFVRLALGERELAAGAWRTAAELGPDYPEAQVNHGLALVDAGDHGAAIPRLEAAVKLAPTLAEAWLGLGNAYRGAKRLDEAEAAYRRALAEDPELADAEFDLALLDLDGDRPGIAAVDRLERALVHLDRFAALGGADERTAACRKEAQVALEREKKRLAREEKDQLRKEADAVRKTAAAEVPR